jgi:hypothetical protein
VQVQGSDFATSVRLVLTVSPGTAGPNTFTAKLTDYDTGADRPASRVARRPGPGRPTLYTITLTAGGTLQAYLDPGRPGANTVHFTFFTPAETSSQSAPPGPA